MGGIAYREHSRENRSRKIVYSGYFGDYFLTLFLVIIRARYIVIPPRVNQLRYSDFTKTIESSSPKG